MDEKDLSLLYRPQIEIDRNYHSDAVIPHEPVTNVPEERREEVPEIPTDIEKAIQQKKNAVEKLIRIRKITPVLPTLMQPTINDFLDTVIVWTGMGIPALEEVKEEDEAKTDEEKYEIPGNMVDEGETEPESSDDEWPTMTSSGFIFNVIKNKDSWDLARDQYLLDSAAIQEDFAEEYNNVMEGYVYQLVSSMEEIGLDAPEYLNYEYEGDTVQGVPANYQHLNDIIVRNQDVVADYCDIFRKTHDEYTTYGILTAYDVASQERIRYLKEQYKPDTAANYIEMYDKNYLADTRDEFENRYVAARTNVYKLLHSAAQMSKEMLDCQLRLAISKCSLLSKNINIFAKKEYENEVYANSTSAQSKDDKKDSTTKPVTEPVEKKQSTPQDSIKKEADNTIKNVQQKTVDAANGAVQKIKDQVINKGTATKVKTVAENPKKKAEKKGQST